MPRLGKNVRPIRCLFTCISLLALSCADYLNDSSSSPDPLTGYETSFSTTARTEVKTEATTEAAERVRDKTTLALIITLILLLLAIALLLLLIAKKHNSDQQNDLPEGGIKRLCSSRSNGQNSNLSSTIITHKVFPLRSTNRFGGRLVKNVSSMHNRTGQSWQKLNKKTDFSNYTVYSSTANVTKVIPIGQLNHTTSILKARPSSKLHPSGLSLNASSHVTIREPMANQSFIKRDASPHEPSRRPSITSHCSQLHPLNSVMSNSPVKDRTDEEDKLKLTFRPTISSRTQMHHKHRGSHRRQPQVTPSATLSHGNPESKQSKFPNAASVKSSNREEQSEKSAASRIRFSPNAEETDQQTDSKEPVYAVIRKIPSTRASSKDVLKEV